MDWRGVFGPPAMRGRPRNLLGDPQPRGESRIGTLGESVLAGLSVTSIQGLINPSYLDVRYKSADPGMRIELKRTLNYSLGLTLATSVALGLGFKNWIPGAVGIASSLAIYWMYSHAITLGPPVPVAQSAP